MKKIIIWLVAIVVMIGVVIGGIHWYKASVNNVIENPNNDLSSGNIEINSGDENNIETISKLETAYKTIINAQPENAEALILFSETSDDYINGLYEGLKDIKMKEKVLYVHPIGMACEIALVEVENEDDIEKVKKIFEDRIEKGINAAMCDSASQDIWRKRAEIQVKDNCICMIVLPDRYEIPENIF